MNDILTGRWTARREEPFVVFIIGMRINQLWKVHRWLPVFVAMPRMLIELHRNQDAGFLGAKTWFGRTTVVIQYWRSFEDLEAYAKARDKAHLPAWAAFNRAIGTSGEVGVFHETYRVGAGQYENVYVNMPRTLLGAVSPLSAANGHLSSARGRIETV